MSRMRWNIFTKSTHGSVTALPSYLSGLSIRFLLVLAAMVMTPKSITKRMTMILWLICQFDRDCLSEMKRFSGQGTQLQVQKRCMNSIKGFFRKLFKHGGEQENHQKAVATPWPSI